MTTGYSGTPLPAKLGIADGRRVLTVAKPADVSLGEFPPSVVVHTRRGGGHYDVVVLFAPDQRSLSMCFDPLVPALTQAGGLWVCWPKKASGIPTDLSDQVVRGHGLRSGLVDVKVAAIDSIWSGIKFVRRLADREATS